MDNEPTIMSTMVQHHSRLLQGLETLLALIEEDSDRARPLFEAFRRELEQHFHTEEWAIFTFLSEEERSWHPEIDDLMDEHETIRGAIEHIGVHFGGLEVVELRQLASRLSDHQLLEEEALYSRLDMELTEGQRMAMIQRIVRSTESVEW